MAAITEADTLLELSVWALASDADVHSPDDVDSDGGKFLQRLQTIVNEADWQELVQGVRDNSDAHDAVDVFEDSIHEWADGAVPVYTYTAWKTFVDLCLWDEDVDDLGEISGADLTRDVAMRALYMAASRAIRILLEQRAEKIHEFLTQNEEDADGDDD